MTYNDCLRQNLNTLLASGYEKNEAMADIRLLLTFVSGITHEQYFMCLDKKMPEEEAVRFGELTLRLKEHEPVDYIIGSRNFCGLEFKVDESTLIPRQETELLVEETLVKLTELFKKRKDEGRQEKISVLDLATGSGCIIAALAKLAEKSYNKYDVAPEDLVYYASDISEPALAVAEENAVRHGVPVNFIKSDMFNELEACIRKNDPDFDGFDIIVSNPPYIPDSEVSALEKKVADHEPHTALFGGADGLDFYRIIAENAGRFLKPSGSLLLEIGFDQGESVPALLLGAGFDKIKVIKDYAGLDRIVVCKIREEDNV